MLLEIKNLSKSFDGMVAIRDLSLSFPKGELRCIIGPNGSGKTTLFNLITGHLSPSGGSIIYDGQEITNMPVHKIAGLGICRKFQNPNVFGELTVEDNLRVAAIGQQKIRRLFRRTDQQQLKEDIDRILTMIELQEKSHWAAESLSHGQKQWLEIGMVLIKKPKMILLDEPTAGMPSHETAKTAELIRQISSETTVVVIEHDLDFIRSLHGRVTVLNRGDFLAEGSYDEIAANQQVRDVYLGDEI